MPNPLYTYISNDLAWLGFYGISTIMGYLMPNPLYTYKYIKLATVVERSEGSLFNSYKTEV